MNFNSVVFLFCFMPLALGLYYLVPGRVKNAVLLVESLLFFCWGGITWLPLAVGMVAINYAAGLLLASLPAGGKRKIVLIAAIVLTAAALVYCKYTNFLLDTLNVIASTGFAKLSFLDVLPLGISYYTFKLISYTADVYTGKIKAERSPVVFAVYVLMYPQLIVGPIVKYRDMADVLHQTLAAVAHQPFRLVPGLHLYPAGWQPLQCRAPDAEHAGRLGADRHLAWCELELYLLGPLLFRAACHRKELFDEVPEKRQGLAAHLHIVPGGTGLGAVHLQRPRCTAGAAAQPVVHPAGRRFGAVFPAQLCGAAGCVLCLLHPTAGAVLAVVQRQSPATGSALRRLLCSVHGVCGSSNGFHRTVCKLLRGGMALWKNMFTADLTVICRQLP